MMKKTLTTIAIIATLAGSAGAQTTAPATRSGLGGLLGGALGGGLPDLASAGAGNVAGVLGYCLKNNLLGGATTGGAGGLLGGAGALLPRGAIPGNAATGTATPQIATPAPIASGVAAPTGPAATGAQSVLQRLLGQRGVKASPGFAAGQAGRLQAGDQALSIGGLGGRVKTRMCAMVLDRAKSFL